VDGISSPTVQSPSQVQQPRRLAFSYADAVKAGHTLLASGPIQEPDRARPPIKPASPTM